MNAIEIIRKAIEIIGRGEQQDYIISPTKHAEEFGKNASDLADILSSSIVATTARQYENEDNDALAAQTEFKRVFNRANFTVLATGVFVALFMATAALNSFLPDLTEKVLLVVLSLGGVISGALASKDLLMIKRGSLLENWMSKRASAETTRIDYFDMVAKAHKKVTTKSEVPVELLQLEYFRRFQLDVQVKYYHDRSIDHREEAKKTLSYSGWAVAGAAVATGSAGLLGAAIHPGLAAIGAFGAVFTGLSSFASMREAVNQNRRNAERYERTCYLLEELNKQLDRVRIAVCAGEKQALIDFVDAVHEQLSLEHRQWLGEQSKARGAFARLENTLKELTSKLKGSPEVPKSESKSHTEETLKYEGEECEPMADEALKDEGEELELMADEAVSIDEPLLTAPPPDECVSDIETGAGPLNERDFEFRDLLEGCVETEESEDIDRGKKADRIERAINEKTSPAHAAQPSEKVEFAVFGPGGIKPASAFVLDIWAYLPDQYSTIVEMAKEVRREINLGRKTGVHVKRGSILSVQIEIATLEAEDPLDTIVWDGDPTNASFIINVPPETKVGTYPGKISIAHDGLPIAKLVFTVSVALQDHPEYRKYSGDTQCPQTAFASYSSENRDDVLSRIQGMKKIAPDLDIFVDVLSLRSGQNWKDKLEKHVPSKDTFYLFWSRSAADSEWVEREWRLALDRRGISYIDPVPLEEPDIAPPPRELMELHFSDAFLAHIAYERLKKRMRN